MKSAYELAMERLQKGAPSVSLTDEQKKQLAEIDSTFKARSAAKELFLKGEILKAQNSGKLEDAEAWEKQYASEGRRLQDDREAKKETERARFAQSEQRRLCKATVYLIPAFDTNAATLS